MDKAEFVKFLRGNITDLDEVKAGVKSWSEKLVFVKMYPAQVRPLEDILFGINLESDLKHISRLEGFDEKHIFNFYSKYKNAANLIGVVVDAFENTNLVNLIGTTSSSDAAISERDILDISQLAENTAISIAEKIQVVDLIDAISEVVTDYESAAEILISSKNPELLADLCVELFQRSSMTKKQLYLLADKISSKILSRGVEELGGETKQKETKQQKNVVQESMISHNLVPAATGLDLAGILKKYFNIKVKGDGKIKTSELKSLIGKQKTIGLVIMNKSTFGTPLYNDIRPLIDRAYIKKHNLTEEKGAGISDKTIQRTETIHSTFSFENVSGVIDIYPAKNNEKYYIFDTIDGNLYRIMMPWYNASEEYAVPTEWLNFDHQKEIVNNYNLLLNSEIEKYIAEKSYIDLLAITRSERVEKKIEWKITRNSIKKEIIRHLAGKATGGVKMEKLQTSAMDIGCYKDALQLMADEVRDIFIPEKLKENQVAYKKYQFELDLSIQAEINYISANISRQIIKLSRQLGAKTVTPVQLSEILDEVLKKFINEKSNIFTVIEAKSEIMERTLLEAL